MIRARLKLVDDIYVNQWVSLDWRARSAWLLVKSFASGIKLLPTANRQPESGHRERPQRSPCLGAHDLDDASNDSRTLACGLDRRHGP